MSKNGLLVILCSVSISSRFFNKVTTNADVVPYILYDAPIKDIEKLYAEVNIQKQAEIDLFDRKVAILLGAEHYERCILEERKFYNDVTIRRIILGNVLIGRLPDSFNLKIPPIRHCCLATDKQFKKCWKLEEYKCDRRRRTTESTYSRNEDGRFIVRLPFKDE